MSATWLVLPTYNEADNLAAMVAAVLPQLASTGVHRVLIVDDNSPDGTGRIADELAAQHEEVEVLHRPGKEGLGRAYVAVDMRDRARNTWQELVDKFPQSKRAGEARGALTSLR